jgi:beta-glucosidase
MAVLVLPINYAAASKDADVERRVEQILRRMTTEEKIAHIGGHNDFYIRGIERLGVPEIRLDDGPQGIRHFGQATGYPASISLAATWNMELAQNFGRSIARDARSRGVHVWLAPGVNMHRSPLCGRNFEYLGEDPYLAGMLASEVVRSLQSNGVLATVKHFAANNQEFGRHGISSDMDERTLREIYLPAFEMCVKRGGAAFIMAAYNPLNGIHCTENDLLLNRILKGEWGFDGAVMSDWGSTYDGVAAATAGLDLEMPNGKRMNAETLLPALANGKVTMDELDDKVRRILRVTMRAGFFDRPQVLKDIPRNDPRSRKVALDLAREAVVLLKNEGGALPLDPDSLKSIAVIGMNAHPAMPQGGGSGHTWNFRQTTILDGIRAAAGEGVEVRFNAGNITSDTMAMARNSRYEHVDADGVTTAGMKVEFFTNPDLKGEPALTRVDSVMNYIWAMNAPAPEIPSDNWSARWTGQIRPTVTGDHRFLLRVDDAARVWLDGKVIIDQWASGRNRVVTASEPMEAGRTYDLKIEYRELAIYAILHFGWAPEYNKAAPPEVELARECDVAIVCAGFNSDTEREGSDRTFELPYEQGDMIRQVAAANPRTIVVLTGGGNMEMESWINDVEGVFHAWFPGQEGGEAIAELLFGEVNPSGKLPVSFERVPEDNPTSASYHSPDKKGVFYSEGVFMGYRGYDKSGIKPRFAFGHGLSYTTFEFSDLKVTKSVVRQGDEMSVSFSVKNTGDRAGATVGQVYVQDPESSVPRPLKELKGFTKLMLKPGQSQRVTVPLSPEALKFWHPSARKWVAEAGKFAVLVGPSSDDLPLRAEFNLE